MSKKKIGLIFAIFAVLIAAAAVLISLPKSKENKWLPEVQGSHVEEMPYEDIVGDYSVEKYSDFKSFKRSELANYEFVGERAPSKEGRYSKEFFKTRDLAVIKFNKPEKGIKYTVINADVSGNDCCVSLLPVKDTMQVETQDTTYYCFLETEKNISDWDIQLAFEEEVVHETQCLYYTDKHDRPYLYDETAPVIFRISSNDGIADFIEYDEVIEKDNFISFSLRYGYPQEKFNEYDLLLIRVSSSYLEDCAAFINNDTAEIVCVKTNHYMFGWEKDQKSSNLIAVLVPKDFKLGGAARTNYTEYEDNADNQPVRGEYTINKTTAITENLTRYDLK